MADKKMKLLPDLSVDCAIFGFSHGKLEVLLIKRTNPWMTSQWALPGYNICQNESAEDAAARILYEMSGVKDIYLEPGSHFQCRGPCTWTPNRDHRLHGAG